MFQFTFSVRRTGHESLRRREIRMAKVSITIVIIFLICHTPKTFPTILELLHKAPHPLLIEMSHLLLTINSSVNFLIYWLLAAGSSCPSRCFRVGKVTTLPLASIVDSPASAPTITNLMSHDVIDDEV